MTKSLVHRLQKWLINEPFDIHYNPEASPPFKVSIKGFGIARFEGSGFSIAQAAKIAFQSRERFYDAATMEDISHAGLNTGKDA
jgi:hypothetical protein